MCMVHFLKSQKVNTGPHVHPPHTESQCGHISVCVCVCVRFGISALVIISGKEYEEFIMSIFVF